MISLTSSATLILADSLQLQLSSCCSGKTPGTLLPQDFCTSCPSDWNALLPDIHVAHSHSLEVFVQMSPSQKALPWLNYLKLQTPVPGTPSANSLLIPNTLFNLLIYFLLFSVHKSGGSMWAGGFGCFIF